MSTLLDEETVLLEGLDFDLPCTRRGDHAAEVLMQCRYCGEGVNLCKDHYEAARRHVEDYLARQVLGVVTCSECKRQELAFDDLVKVVPL